MKKYFLFFTLLSVVLISLPNDAFARKKYRYIKREHGVKFDWKPPSFEFAHGGVLMNIDLGGAYTYNWNGMVEVGPYFGFKYSNKDTQNMMYNGGLLVEYNIIKNRGKRKWIPAVGLKVGVEGDNTDSTSPIKLAAGVHGACKIFVGKRTPFTVALGYRAVTPMQGMFQTLSHNMDISMGFSYYFDFY